MLLFATHVRESKPSINDPLGCCNFCKYPSESGKRLPRTQSGYDALWVIMDRLTKVAHFRPIKMTYTGPQLVEMYMLRIACFHGVPMRIVAARETQVISKFWDRLPETMDIHPNFSSAYHPQTDGQPRE
jgi:hypothetical protein